MSHHLITLMLVFPLLGVLFQAFLPSQTNSQLTRWIALGTSFASSICGIALVASMQPGTAELQANEALSWIGSYAISYDMGIDGMNILMVLLIAIVFPLLIASEWNKSAGIRGLHGLLLILQSSLAGAVCAQDLFLLFFFWALSALPLYFLIGIWGGEERESAAFRSIVAASAGNVLFFAALILVYYSVDPHTFSLRDLAGNKLGGHHFSFAGYDISVPALAFGLVSAGLVLRIPIWPFQGWFTRVAEEAPPSVFVALSAAIVPVGIYIFMRLSYALFPSILPEASIGIVVVGILNLLIGGICAAAQRNLRLLLASVCIGEVGYILIGVGSLNSAGAVGAVYQLLALGLGLTGLGLFSGVMIERTGRNEFLKEDGTTGFGGIATKAPTMALVVGVVIASLLGFPGFGGFVGHALLSIGSYSIHPLVLGFAACALMLATYYFFTMYRHVFLGSSGDSGKSFPDLSIREQTFLLPIVGCLLVFGVYPKPLLDLVRPTVLTLLSTIK